MDFEEEAIAVQRAYHRHLISKFGEANCPLVVAKDKLSIRYTFDHPEPEIPKPLLNKEGFLEGAKLVSKWTQTLRLKGVSEGSMGLLYLQAVNMEWLSGEMNEIQMFKAFLSFLLQHKSQQVPDLTHYPKKFKDFWTRCSSEYFVSEYLVDPFYAAPKCNIQALLVYARKALKAMDSDPTQILSLFNPLTNSNFDLIAQSEEEFPFSFLEILQEAAGDRFPLIHCFEDGRLLGIVMNPATCFGLAVLGPVNSEENVPLINRFRQLWGKRAELRKFAAEGAIRCCVVFEEAAGDRLELGKLILEHLFATHCPNITLTVPYESFKGVYHFESLQGVIGVYEEFGRVLRAVKGLPLSIVETVPLGSTLCGLSTQVPKNVDNSGRIQLGTTVQEVMLIFEKSGKWPEDLQAIKHLKTALLLALSNNAALSPLSFKKNKNNPNLSSTSLSDEGFMDVLFKGVVFRLHVFCEKELLVMRRDGLETSVYWNEWVARPMHYRLMGQLIPRYTLFAPACRLFKHWVKRHRLSLYLDERTCELLIASVFLLHETGGLCNLVVVLYNAFKIITTMDSAPVQVDIDGRLDREVLYNDFYRLKKEATSPSLVFVTSPKIQPECSFIKTVPKPVQKYILRTGQACARYLEEFFNARIPTLTELFTPLPMPAAIVLKWSETFHDNNSVISPKLEQLIRGEAIGSAPFMRTMPSFDPRSLVIGEIMQRYAEEVQVYPDEDSLFIITTTNTKLEEDLLSRFPGAFC